MEVTCDTVVFHQQYRHNPYGQDVSHHRGTVESHQNQLQLSCSEGGGGGQLLLPGMSL